MFIRPTLEAGEYVSLTTMHAVLPDLTAPLVGAELYSSGVGHALSVYHIDLGHFYLDHLRGSPGRHCLR